MSESISSNQNQISQQIVVLLVDDQAMVSEMVRRALSKEVDIEFHYCSDANDALAFAEEVKPSVILQDLMMPNINGLMLLRMYRENETLKDVPVIVLSVKEEAAIKSGAFQQGANDYLIKLPDPIELIARVRYHSKSYLNQKKSDHSSLALAEAHNEIDALKLEIKKLKEGA